MNDEQQQLIIKEKERQAKVEADKKNCTHVGYYVGFGFEIIPMANGQIQCLTAQNCMMCGETFVKLAIVGNPHEQPKEEAPSIISPNN